MQQCKNVDLLDNLNASQRLLDDKETLNQKNEINNLNKRNSNKISNKRGGGMFLAVARMLGIGWRKRQLREKDKESWNYNEEPTLLDSDWHRPGEVLKFRNHRKEVNTKNKSMNNQRANMPLPPSKKGKK